MLLPIGLLMPLRLPLRVKNASSYFQAAVESIFIDMPEFQKNIWVYQDDIYWGANSFSEFMRLTWEIFKRVYLRGATLHGGKTKLGFFSCIVLGSLVSASGIQPGPEHLEAARRFPVTASSVTEVRSILGFYGHYQKHFPRYSEMVAPLTDLTSKSSTFRWTKECTAIVKRLRSMLLSAPVLVKFNPHAQLYLAVDASKVGWGGVLYHVEEKLEHPIRFLSGKFTSAQRRWPPYIREAYAIVTGIRKVRPYADCSVPELEVVTDHKPLRFILTARSPKVEKWVVEVLSEVAFYVVWRAGVLNGAADAMSRPPMVAPGVPTDEGLLFLVSLLLKAIKLPHGTLCIFLSLQGQEQAVAPGLKGRGRSFLYGSPSETRLQSPWDVAIVAPTSDRSPAVARALFRLEKSFCCLIPGDLVHLISFDGEKVDLKLQERVDKAAKIVYMRDNLVWICVLPGPVAHQVFLNEPVEEKGSSPSTPAHQLPNRTEVVAAQTASPEISHWQSRGDSFKINREVIIRRDNVFYRVDPSQELLDGARPGKHPLVLAQSLVSRTVRVAHRQLNHAGSQRLQAYLSASFWWPGMAKDVARIVGACHLCLLAKARKAVNHGRYSSMTFSRPRQAYGIDHYGPTTRTKDGWAYILTVQCLFSGFVFFLPSRGQKADETIELLTSRIFWVFGFPEIILSDAHPSFRSRLVKGVCAVAGLRWLLTAPRSQYQNGRVERAHANLNVMMKALTDKSAWPAQLAPTAAAVNSLVSATTGLSPAEIFFGTPLSLPVDHNASMVPKYLRLPQAQKVEVKAKTQWAKKLQVARDIFSRVAAERSQADRKKRVDRKNAQRTTTYLPKVGDLVRIHRPQVRKDI